MTCGRGRGVESPQGQLCVLLSKPVICPNGQIGVW